MKSHLLIISLFLLSVSSHAQWTPGGIQLSSTPDNNFSQQIAMNNNDSSWEVWRAEDTVSQNGTIYLTGYDKHGDPLSGFTNGADSISANGDFYMPQIILSSDSDLIVTWYGYPDTASSFSEVYIQKFTQAGVAVWNGGNAIMVSVADSSENKFPLIASDKDGGAYVYWNRSYYNVDPPYNVILQRIDKNGNVASGWPIAPQAFGNIPGQNEWYAKITVTPAGDALYMQYYRGLIGALSLWLIRINAADGSVATGFNTGSGVEISQGPNLSPVFLVDNFILCDSSGNALSVWAEYRISANGEIYYQKTSTGGSQSFPLNGTLISGNTGEGYDYLYASLDDDGNILATWNDYSVNYDVGCIKFKPNGGTVWQHGNTPVTANNNSAYPKIIPDHKGGSYIFYEDVSTYPSGLYCLRLDATGNLSWPLPGLSVGLVYTEDGFDPQFDFQVANVDSNQANITWTYSTTDLFNVYACDVLPSKESCFNAPLGLTPLYTLQDEITIAPNPSIDNFTVSVSRTSTSPYQSPNISNPIYFELYNEIGVLVLRQTFTSDTKGINAVVSTSGIARGMYFGKVFDEKKNCLAVKKIVLQ